METIIELNFSYLRTKYNTLRLHISINTKASAPEKILHSRCARTCAAQTHITISIYAFQTIHWQRQQLRSIHYQVLQSKPIIYFLQKIGGWFCFCIRNSYIFFAISFHLMSNYEICESACLYVTKLISILPNLFFLIGAWTRWKCYRAYIVNKHAACLSVSLAKLYKNVPI